MLDVRQLTNPSIANEDLYELALLDRRRRPFKKSYDYYIRAVSYNIDKLAKFQTDEFGIFVGAQIGVIVKQDCCHSIFQQLDMRDYVCKCITGFTINKWNIHNAFNKAVSK